MVTGKRTFVLWMNVKSRLTVTLPAPAEIKSGGVVDDRSRWMLFIRLRLRFMDYINLEFLEVKWHQMEVSDLECAKI